LNPFGVWLAAIFTTTLAAVLKVLVSEDSAG